MADATKSKGLEGVVIGSSSVSLVEGTEGRLSYRGYRIQDLAANSSYEEVLYLLLYGELPNAAQLKGITNALHERREVGWRNRTRRITLVVEPGRRAPATAAKHDHRATVGLQRRRPLLGWLPGVEPGRVDDPEQSQTLRYAYIQTVANKR